MQTSVLLVDDHPLFRKGLRLLLEEESDLKVVGEAGDGQAGIELAQELSPDVIVMDISMPDLDGIEATQSILAEAPDAKIIALSIHSKKDFVQGMLRAGAAGYILKQSAPEEVVVGIRAVRAGEVFLSATITGIIVSDYRSFLSDAPVIEDQGRGTIPSPILTAKLHRPRISQSTILRTRLLDLLTAGNRRQLTLVSAPAGYGKTTLLSHWLEAIEGETPGAWLSLDENDNDLPGFMTYLVAAVETQFPDALQATKLLLKAPDLPSLLVLARSLANDLEGIPGRFILVLDDYHHIEEPSVHELLVELLRHPLQTTHLVLATRTDPPLDLLKLNAHQQVVELRAGVLSFTVEETAAFLQKIVGAEVDEKIIAALTEKTEGWVTGLRLMTLAAYDSSELANLSITIPGEQQTLDYLIAETLSQQPHDVQAWLLKTSILDRFCAPLCQAVCISPEESEPSNLTGDKFIRWLTNRNLFVIPQDHHGQWYRYHKLFQELLQSQLENALDADEIAALYTRANRWLVEHGLIDQAVGGGDQILAAFSAPVPSDQPDLDDPLTERERQVLKLLATALSAGEIAEQLVVSVNTVRMHTKNIYSKLDVHNRMEAIERAAELGLL